MLGCLDLFFLVFQTANVLVVGPRGQGDELINFMCYSINCVWSSLQDTIIFVIPLIQYFIPGKTTLARALASSKATRKTKNHDGLLITTYTEEIAGRDDPDNKREFTIWDVPCSVVAKEGRSELWRDIEYVNSLLAFAKSIRTITAVLFVMSHSDRKPSDETLRSHAFFTHVFLKAVEQRRFFVVRTGVGPDLERECKFNEHDSESDIAQKLAEYNGMNIYMCI